MSSRILPISVLLLSVWLCLSAAGPNGRHISRRFPPCCVAQRICTVNISSEVIGETYRKQSPKPPCVEAIIFTTADGDVCVDPNMKWVKNLTANMTLKQ